MHHEANQVTPGNRITLSLVTLLLARTIHIGSLSLYRLLVALVENYIFEKSFTSYFLTANLKFHT